MMAALDGCKAGWIASTASSWPIQNDDLSTAIYANFRDAIDALEACSIIVFDMPAGLSDPQQNISWPRACDKAAKRLLGSAHPRVFFAPPRSVLQSESYGDFKQSHINLTGKSVSKQAWSIVPKIREVDDVLTAAMQSKVKEYHPELVFYNLSGNGPLAKKNSPEGQVARRHHISTGIGTDDLMRAETWVTETQGVAIDDLYDSLIGLELCQRIVDNTAKVIPDNSHADIKGLRIEIWY